MGLAIEKEAYDIAQVIHDHFARHAPNRQANWFRLGFLASYVLRNLPRRLTTSQKIRRAVALEAPINDPNSSGETALIIAARDGESWLVKLLIELGADRTMKDKKQKSAYDYFREHPRARHFESTLRLLE